MSMGYNLSMPMYLCENCPYMMTDLPNYDSEDYLNDAVEEEEEELDNMYRQPFYAPRPFFRPRPFYYPPPYYFGRPFYPGPFFYPRPFYGAPFLAGLALGGLLF